MWCFSFSRFTSSTNGGLIPACGHWKLGLWTVLWHYQSVCQINGPWESMSMLRQVEWIIKVQIFERKEHSGTLNIGWCRCQCIKVKHRHFYTSARAHEYVWLYAPQKCCEKIWSLVCSLLPRSHLYNGQVLKFMLRVLEVSNLTAKFLFRIMILYFKITRVFKYFPFFLSVHQLRIKYIVGSRGASQLGGIF